MGEIHTGIIVDKYLGDYSSDLFLYPIIILSGGKMVQYKNSLLLGEPFKKKIGKVGDLF